MTSWVDKCPVQPDICSCQPFVNLRQVACFGSRGCNLKNKVTFLKSNGFFECKNMSEASNKTAPQANDTISYDVLRFAEAV